MDTDVQNGKLSSSRLNYTGLQSQSMHPQDQLCGFRSRIDFKSLVMTYNDLKVPRGSVYKQFRSLAAVNAIRENKSCPVCRLISACIRSYPYEIPETARSEIICRSYDMRRRHTESHERIREAWLGRVEVYIAGRHLHDGGELYNYQCFWKRANTANQVVCDGQVCIPSNRIRCSRIYQWQRYILSIYRNPQKYKALLSRKLYLGSAIRQSRCSLALENKLRCRSALQSHHSA